MKTQIEFTDRYGGNPPSGLRGCFECEAMGWSPEPCYADPQPTGYTDDGIRAIPTDAALGVTEPCPRPTEHQQPDWDGWHFLRCAECWGTGRVPWYVSIARIPRWLAKGAAFFWRMSDRRYQPSHFTYRQHISLVFKCAFIYDLLRLRR
jgi:hypothetical protein